MDQEKYDQQKCGQKMHRPRRLATAKQVGQERPVGIHRRRHGEPGRDHQRQQDEYHPDIGQFLDHIIGFA